MKNKVFFTWMTVFCLSLLYSCSKMDEYKKYVPEKPHIYPAMADSVKVLPGNNRVQVRWVLTSDATITHAKVFWNGYSDSASLPITRTSGTDTVSIIIDGLEEASYTFTIFTYDKENNRSVPATKTGKAYGAKYNMALHNRAVENVNYEPSTGTLVVAWSLPDTVYVNTKLYYTDADGMAQQLVVKPGETASSLSWQIGSKIYYQSSYKPTSDAIDTFSVLQKDSVTVTNVPVPKAAWAALKLPNDIATDAYGTSMDWLWDGKGGDYPEIYHTDGSGIPHHFTFDLGASYQLTKFENIGRLNDNPYHNATKFEVWGINDLAGAATTLAPGDAGWADEAIAKGWILMRNIERPDNGTAPYKVDLLPNLPAVRYIRIRVLETIDHDPDSHMSEVSFWFNP